MNASTPSKRRLWIALVPAMGVPLIASFVYFVLMAQSDGASLAYGATKVFLLSWPVIATLFILRKRFGLRDHSLRHHLRALPLGIGIGLAIAAVMAVWMASPLSAIIDGGAPGVKEKVESLGFADNFIAFAIFVALAHSFFEEFYWRWFVYGNLRHLFRPRLAHAVAAVGFAAHHVVITSQFYPFGFACFLSFCVGVGGYIWSHLYERQKSLAGAWISHLIVDAGLMVIGFHLLQQ